MPKKRRIPIEDDSDLTSRRESEAEPEPDLRELEAKVEEEPELDGEQAPPETAAGPVEQLEAALKEARDDHLRAVADLRNFRRRAREEQQDAIRYGKEVVLETMLPVLDNLERALSAAGESPEFEALIQGVELTQKQLQDALTQHGVRPIEALGQPFDPHLHDAVGRLETDRHREGTIVEELLKGYMMGDTVLRHSRVIVAASPSAAPEEQDPAG